MSRTKSRARAIALERERRRTVAPPRAPRWIPWLIPPLIILATFAAFSPALHDLFAWDDSVNFLDNPHYRGLGWSQLRWMFTTFHMGHYIPLTWLTLGLDYVLWGLDPFGYHLTNLLLHATNAGIFYLVARRILGAALPHPAQRGQTAVALSAGAAALLFALHPLRVESVAWVTERRDVLSGLFYLLAILIYLRSCEQGERGRGGYWISLALFGCAVLSKSMAVSLPALLLILDVYPLRRVGSAAGWWSPSARRVYAEKVPFFVLGGAVSAIAFVALLQQKNMAALNQVSVVERLAITAYGLGFYVWKTVAPVRLSALYELPVQFNPWQWPFTLSYGVFAVITTVAVGLRRRLPGVAAAWFAYAVILFPVLGFFQNGPQIAADRYTYLACLGWAVLAGAGLLACWRLAPFLTAGLVVCVLLALGVLTWNQAQVWHDSEKVWAHALDMDPGSAIAHNNLGGALVTQGKFGEALAHYEQAVRIKPDYAEAHENLGLLLAREGQLDGAIIHYEQAVRVKPDYVKAHYDWGNALARRGELAEAVAHYEQVVRIKPDSALAHYAWGIALADQGKWMEAIEHYRQAVRIRPDFAVAYNNLGTALARQGRPAEAVRQYEEALRIKPDFAEAHFNWANALVDQGRLAEAIAHYEQARPYDADVHNNWGIALERQGRLAEAIAHYEEAVRIKPDFAQARYNWSLARAKQATTVEAQGSSKR